MSDFSQWMYHSSFGAKLFKSEDAIRAAGDEWKDSPSEHGKPLPPKPALTPAVAASEEPVKTPAQIADESLVDPLTFDPATITINPDDDDLDGPAQKKMEDLTPAEPKTKTKKK